MNLNTIWSAMMGAIEPLSNLALDQAAAELDLEPGWITWLWAFCLFGSDPFSTAAYMRIRPYGSARVNEDRFTSAVRQGILTANSQNEYLLTEKGKHFANKFLQAADASIAHLQPIPIAELQKIADYGKRLVEASLAAPEPPSRFAITRYYRNIHPGQEAQLLRLVLHYVATLDQYRGAAHLASWQHHNLEGCAWSVLTSIWRGEANTLDALHEEVGQPVFSREEILQALRDLVNRGWIEERTDKYQMTPEGQRIRQEAEELTDRHFFPPWACLNETEQEDLLSLATQLSAGLKNSMGK